MRSGFQGSSTASVLLVLVRWGTLTNLGPSLKPLSGQGVNTDISGRKILGIAFWCLQLQVRLPALSRLLPGLTLTTQPLHGTLETLCPFYCCVLISWTTSKGTTMALTQWLSTGAFCSPRGCSAASGDMFGDHNCEAGGMSGIQWVEVRMWQNVPQRPAQPPSYPLTETDLAPNVNGARIKTLSSR